MNVIKRTWVIPIILTIVLLVVGGFIITTVLSSEEPLSEDSIKTRVAELYSAKIGQFTKEGDIYKAELMKDGAIIEAQIDSMTGNVLSLKQVSAALPSEPGMMTEEEIRKQITDQYTGEIKNVTIKKDTSTPVYEVELSNQQTLILLIVDALSGKVIAEDKKESTPPGQQVLITKERAIQIAHGQLKGEVDYITFEQTDDGGYYLLEIDGEDDEATFQIHAISGKILSVTYDDEEENDEHE